MPDPVPPPTQAIAVPGGRAATFSEGAGRRVWAATEAVEAQHGLGVARRRLPSYRAGAKVLASLTEWCVFAMSGNCNRWMYAWVEVYYDTDLMPRVLVDGRSGHWQDGASYALNHFEMTNLTSGTHATGVNGDNLPGTYLLQPIGGGRTSATQVTGLVANEACVTLEQHMLIGATPEDNRAQWVFGPLANSYEGGCE